MARIPYVDEHTNPELSALIARIKHERGGRLLNLYAALLNSPKVAEGWLNLFTAIRQQCELPGVYRELAIMAIAVINGADYEYRQHVPFALKEGMTQAQLDELPRWKESMLFTDAQFAVLRYTESMTRDIQVPDEIYRQVALHFPPQQIVELTATIAGYNLVSRFLEALKIDHD